jgi:hypothetical protein
MAEHKGIVYVVRAAPGEHHWIWTAYTTPDRPRTGDIICPKRRAELAACQAIDAWLRANPPAGKAS